MTSTQSVLDVLVREKITHVVGIPDNTSAPLFDAVALLAAPVLVRVTREGEAFALAAGLWMGGAAPLVVIQNTGLLESGDALRGTAVRMRAPVPMVVTGRGYAKMRAAALTPAEPRSAELLARADVDSTALLTEPTLAAWGVPFEVCDGDADPAGAVRRAIVSARAHDRPVAVVLARELD